MNPSALPGTPLRPYQTLLEATASWGDVRTLLETLGEVTADADGNLSITRNGHRLTLHPALTRNPAESGELTALDRFLHDSESEPAGAAGRDPHLLLIMRGTEARVYRCQVSGGTPQVILTYEPKKPDPGRHVAGKQTPPVAPTPAPSAGGFFIRIADELQAAGQIVIFDTGAGTDATSFVAWLNQHDSELSGRVLGTVRIDEAHLDQVGLLAVAREFYATLHLPAPKFGTSAQARQWSGPRAEWPQITPPGRTDYGLR